MALIVKGVFDVTCSIFNAVVHVLLRDLTNYYWAVEEAERQNDAAVERLISNLINENANPLRSTTVNERIELECGGERMPNESFCTKLNLEDSTLNVLDEDNFKSVKPPEKKSSMGKLDYLDEETGVEDDNMVQNYLNMFQSPEFKFTNAESPEQESSNTFDNLDEIISIEDNNEILDDEENLNCLISPKKQNRIWITTDSPQQNYQVRNYIPNPYYLIADEESTGNTHEDLPDEKEMKTDLQLEEKDSVSVIDEKSNPPVDSIKSTETFTLKNDDETGESLVSEEGKGLENILKSYTESSENFSIGDSRKDEPEFQIDNKSNISSECELGIRNFQIQNVIDECSKLVTSEKPKQTKKEAKNKQMKSKISRYIGNTTLPKNRKAKEPITLDNVSTAEPKNLSQEVEKMPLQPLTSYEITNTQPLLNESETTELSSDVTSSKCTLLQDDLSEISKVPVEMSDLGSVCSDDSWESWFGKFASLMQTKSPVKNTDDKSIEKIEKEENQIADVCDCVDTHPCLLVVDNDEEDCSELLTPEQLGSVETGSVSDWLYRVNPPNPLLQSKTKSNETQIHTTETQGENTNPYNESSDEDLAKQFFIERWLNETENYHTDPNYKFLGSGDIL